eukprot:TRINITY_DN10319_c0_g1_i1.p1 TRINITY_DN10319_c0_g1~~TRINITY_DN10319_c0_g1_i1.p1  ORF type:complete len:79 (+),score=2.88 TRINITY_DN10319_c0_g1_i1:175-411(+)
MDCQMPIKDGYTASAEIRSSESEGDCNSRIPIIAVTANAFAEDEGHALMLEWMTTYQSHSINLTYLLLLQKLVLITTN